MGMFDPKDFDDENFENELTSDLGTELEDKVVDAPLPFLPLQRTTCL